MVADPEALGDVTEGASGVAAGVSEGSVVVQMSTVGPESIGRLETTLPAGAALLDAPVLGSLSEVEAGELKIFASGAPEQIERARPILEKLGEVLDVGPLGAGTAAKLVANSTLLGVLGVLGEAVALGEALGLARESLFEILATTPLAAQAERRRAALEGDAQPVRFPLALARKDAELIRAAAEAAGAELRIGEAVREWFEDAEAAGLGDRDYSAVLTRIAGR